MALKIHPLKFKLNEQSGFTIVELLIATAVFGAVLLVFILGFFAITNNFYRGATISNTDDTTRNIMSYISQAIQFSPGVEDTPTRLYTPPTSQSFCIGDLRIEYLFGYEYEPNPNSTVDQSSNVLIVNPGSGGLCPAEQEIYCSSPIGTSQTGCSINGSELMGQNMRLSNLEVSSLSNGLFKIDVRVAFGDDNVLCSPTSTDTGMYAGQPDCSTNGTSQFLTSAPDLNCKPGAGSQFCAASELVTIVQQRVT